MSSDAQVICFLLLCALLGFLNMGDSEREPPCRPGYMSDC